MDRRRRLATLTAALALAVSLGGVAMAEDASPTAPLAVAPDASAATPTASQVAEGMPSPIGDPRPAPELVGLVNPDGSPFELAALRGDSILLYFGFTHCPDVCPATIGELFGVWEQVPDMQAVFVTVDPERDTPEFLAKWTSYLPDRLHAVTGDPMAIRRAADAYGVRYARVETDSAGGYTMSHTADLYLIDEHGQLLLAYPFGTPAAEIAADLAVLQAD